MVESGVSEWLTTSFWCSDVPHGHPSPRSHAIHGAMMVIGVIAHERSTTTCRPARDPRNHQHGGVGWGGVC